MAIIVIPMTFTVLIGIQWNLYFSRVVHRSIVVAAAKFKKDNTKCKREKQNCIFFNRFGKCHRGEKCKYLHDPEKVAVCTRCVSFVSLISSLLSLREEQFFQIKKLSLPISSVFFQAFAIKIKANFFYDIFYSIYFFYENYFAEQTSFVYTIAHIQLTWSA